MQTLKTETSSTYIPTIRPSTKIEPEKCQEKASAIANKIIKPLNSIEKWDLETARNNIDKALKGLHCIKTTIEKAWQCIAINTLRAAKADTFFLFKEDEANIDFIKSLCNIAIEQLTACSTDLSNLTELSINDRSNIYACCWKVIEFIDKELDHLT